MSRFVLSTDPKTAFLASHQPNFSSFWSHNLSNFVDGLEQHSLYDKQSHKYYFAHQHLIVRTLAQHATIGRVENQHGDIAFCVVASSFPCPSEDNWQAGCPRGVPVVVIDSQDDADHYIDVGPNGPRARHCLRLWSLERCAAGIIRVSANPPTLTKLIRSRVHVCPTLSVPYLSHGRGSIRGEPAHARPVRIAIAANTDHRDHLSAFAFGYLVWRKALNAGCKQRGSEAPHACVCYGLERRSSLASASISNSEGAVHLYSNSVFCLQPPGDSLPRSAILDAIAVGCIPVFFDPRQRELWPWHWNASAASVTFDWTDGVSRYEGWSNDLPQQRTRQLRNCWRCLLPRARAVLHALESMPAERVKQLQHAVWEAAPHLLYHGIEGALAAGDRSANAGTAVETLLPHLFEAVAKLRSRDSDFSSAAGLPAAPQRTPHAPTTVGESSPSDQLCSSFHRSHLGVCHCHCVLIDVGLNRGRSLLQWPQHAAKLLQRNNRPPWRMLQKCLTPDTSKTSCYYGFEANPAFDEHLSRMERSLRSRGMAVKIFTSTAFTIADVATATATLYVPPMERDATHAVTSTLRGTNSLFEKTSDGPWRVDHSTMVGEVFQRTTVQTMDARRFLAGATDVSAPPERGGLVALKMDCEGCEFDVLPTLLRTAPALLCRISLLAVEPHGRMLPPAQQFVDNETSADTHLFRQLRQRLTGPRRCSVTLMPWG